MAAGRCFPLRLVQRAQINCKAAEGLLSQDIARALRISRPTVRLCCQRFLALPLARVEKDAPHPGRISRVSHRKVQAVVHATLHTTPPAIHWSARSMAKAHGPEQRHHSPDLEAAQPETSLDRNLQAQPLLPLTPGVPARQTHDYKRAGTTTLSAALNMLDGTVIGDCMPRHRHQELIRFLQLINVRTPLRSALASDRRQLRDSQTPSRPILAETPSSFPPIFHSHPQPLAEHSGALVPRDHRQAHPSKVLQERPSFNAVINHYIQTHNQNPTLFVWSASVERIMSKIAKCKETFETLH